MPETDQQCDPVSNQTEVADPSLSKRTEPPTEESENDPQKWDEVEPNDPADKWKRVWVFNRDK